MVVIYHKKEPAFISDYNTHFIVSYICPLPNYINTWQDFSTHTHLHSAHENKYRVLQGVSNALQLPLGHKSKCLQTVLAADCHSPLESCNSAAVGLKNDCAAHWLVVPIWLQLCEATSAAYAVRKRGFDRAVALLQQVKWLVTHSPESGHHYSRAPGRTHPLLLLGTSGKGTGNRGGQNRPVLKPFMVTIHFQVI